MVITKVTQTLRRNMRLKKKKKIVFTYSFYYISNITSRKSHTYFLSKGKTVYFKEKTANNWLFTGDVYTHVATLTIKLTWMGLGV